MNKLKKLQTVFLSKSFVAAAILFSLFALSGHFASATGQTPTWTFKRVAVFPEMDSNNASIVEERVDERGGIVVMSVNGNAKGRCPGGSERLRFTWTLAPNANRVAAGGSIGVNLEARQAGQTRPCTNQIAGWSKMSLHGRAGFADPAGMSRDDLDRLDGDRFDNQYKSHVVYPDPNESKQTIAGLIKVMTHEPPANRPLAWFLLRIETPAGFLSYVYIYERGGTSGGNAGGGNNNNRGGGLGGESMKACDYYLGSGLYNKWQQTGGERGVLGCPVMNEAEAGKSPQGTTGRWAGFRGGLIVWHGNGSYRGSSFSVDGCFFNLYQSVGGTGSWIGFPVRDAYNISGGSRQDFEGGYLQWSSQTGRCQAHKK